MIVIAKDAEQKFCEELKGQKQDLSQIKCLHVQFSRTDVPQKELFDEFLQLLEKIPESFMAEVYICADQDVFILMHAFMEEAFMEAIDTLERKFGGKSGRFPKELFILDQHHKTLYTVAQKKYVEVQQRRMSAQDSAKKSTVDQTIESIMKRLEVGMLDTLQRRRADRRDPVVLVVEDDQLSRTLVSNTIRQSYQTVCAINGEEGLNEFLEHAPDVVFLDIGLPDINGHEVLECLFQLDPNVYVIMFSGRKDKENIMRALRAGAQGFIGKPFTRDKLFEYIGRSDFVKKKKLKIEPTTQAV